MEMVPFDTVKAEFKDNTVLANVLSEEDLEVNTITLSTILSEQFGEVYALAQSSGQGSVLASAFTGTVLAGLRIPTKVTEWLWSRDVLKNHRHYLAEHHIYGSSRLGIQKYLPPLARACRVGLCVCTLVPKDTGGLVRRM